MILQRYNQKRDFENTPEPSGRKKSKTSSKTKKSKHLIFVVQEHHASHLHYDFRLELDGVLKSWAVPKGVPKTEHERRLAIMVEDHPFDYKDFEGVIPKGNYGAGRVYIWDEGVYFVNEKWSKKENEDQLRRALQKGHLNFYLRGKKTKVYFTLVKIKGGTKDNQWLLIRKKENEHGSKGHSRNGGNGHSHPIHLSRVDVKETKSTASKKYPSLKKADLRNINLSGAKKSPILQDVDPMKATLIEEPFDRKGWLFEVKWDGYRAIAEINKKKVRLYSRNLLPFNDKFAPIARELSLIDVDMVLDGEVVALDQDGRSNFQLLQNYMRTGAGNLIYYVFDILYLNGHSLLRLPLIRRRDILQQALPGLKSIRISDYIEERGIAFFELARKNGIEGVIAKNKESIYELGRRSHQWLKVKVIQEQEAVIGGFTQPSGNRKHFGALVLGVYKNDELVYIGHTGGGFNEKGLMDLRKKLEKLITKTCPFNKIPKTNTPATWVKPELVCQVKFSEWTDDGSMRQPIFLGLRLDKDPKDVSREKEVSTKKIVGDVKIKHKDTIEKALRKDSVSKAEAAAKYPTKISGDNPRVKLTNLQKVYWPKEKITKGDMIEYYRQIAPWILPYLKDRPQSLHRHPNGVLDDGFFQKDVQGDVPDWIKTVPVASDSHGGKEIQYMLCQNIDALLFMANWGCIEINVWNSRVNHLDKPDYLVVDLDPLNISFKAVIEAAHVAHEVLDAIKAKHYCKTSGATGLHIYVPLGAQYTYDQVKDFGKIISMVIHKKLPKTTSIERMPVKRQKKVYLDFLQNRKAQTMVSAYCLRPQPGAPVSTPIDWKELNDKLNPKDFNIHNTLDRLKKKGDLFQEVLSKGIDMQRCLDHLLKKYQV